MYLSLHIWKEAPKEFVKYSKDGIMVEKGNLLNGKYHGNIYTYYTNGDIKSVSRFSNFPHLPCFYIPNQAVGVWENPVLNLHMIWKHPWTHISNRSHPPPESVLNQ